MTSVTTKKLKRLLKSCAESRLRDKPQLRCKDSRGRFGSQLTRSQAEQIAHLLNQHNGLQAQYNGDRILNSKADYYPVENEGFVFGSVAVQRWNFLLSEIKHLVTHPMFRGMGMGKLMLTHALHQVDTPIVYATIREGNNPSFHLFERENFRKISVASMEDHRVALMLKENESYKSPKTARKAGTLSDAYSLLAGSSFRAAAKGGLDHGIGV